MCSQPEILKVACFYILYTSKHWNDLILTSICQLPNCSNCFIQCHNVSKRQDQQVRDNTEVSARQETWVLVPSSEWGKVKPHVEERCTLYVLVWLEVFMLQMNLKKILEDTEGNIRSDSTFDFILFSQLYILFFSLWFFSLSRQQWVWGCESLLLYFISTVWTMWKLLIKKQSLAEARNMIMIQVSQIYWDKAWKH